MSANLAPKQCRAGESGTLMSASDPKRTSNLEIFSGHPLFPFGPTTGFIETIENWASGRNYANGIRAKRD